MDQLSDRTPPVPGPNEGVLSPGGPATIQFDVRVNDATPRGTLIVNQATVTTEKVGPVLTDGDGNPATGPEPTVVVVGDAQGLTITKQVSVVGGGAAIAGATLEYLVTVRNVAMVPATGVYVTDDLDETLPGQLLYVDQSALLNGTMNGISVAGTVITANYSSVYGPLAPGQSFVLRFRAQLNPNLAIGTTVKNVAHVTWNTDQTAYAEVSIDVGGTAGSGILNGTVWHDADFDNVLDATERVLEGWTVELRRNDQLIATTTTDAAGVYRITGLAPNYQTQNRYDLTFRAPGAGANTALLGLADSELQKRPATHLRHSGAGRQQPAEPQSSDRSRRCRLQLAVARAVVGREPAARRSEYPQPVAGELLRRSEPAGTSDSDRRVLQVRHQLLRSELSERRQLRDRHGSADARLRNRHFARHTAAGCRGAAVQRADMPGGCGRRNPDDDRLL